MENAGRTTKTDIKEIAGAGCLYLVATPIGNLEDMTFRAVRILQEVDLIAAEDTRNSLKLLNHFDISTPMTSYHEFNRYDKADVLVEKMKEGKRIAAITDAGTPGISDPGEVLVEKCFESGIPVIPVPGASACINALAASGQKTRRFAFEAFLPQEKKEKQEVLEDLRREKRTIILYEAPHRLLRTLEDLQEVLGPDRSLTVCKELTKKHEAFLKTTVGEALTRYGEEDPRGEYVLVIAGKPEEEIRKEKQAVWDGISVEERLRQLTAAGMPKKEAARTVARERGLKRQDVYKIAVSLDVKASGDGEQPFQELK